MADMIHHGTSARGERATSAKLTADQILDIRRRAESESSRTIATDYGVSDRHIRKIVSRRTWAWLDPPSLGAAEAARFAAHVDAYLSVPVGAA